MEDRPVDLDSLCETACPNLWVEIKFLPSILPFISFELSGWNF